MNESKSVSLETFVSLFYISCFIAKLSSTAKPELGINLLSKEIEVASCYLKVLNVYIAIYSHTHMETFLLGGSKIAIADL